MCFQRRYVASMAYEIEDEFIRQCCFIAAIGAVITSVACFAPPLIANDIVAENSDDDEIVAGLESKDESDRSESAATDQRFDFWVFGVKSDGPAARGRIEKLLERKLSAAHQICELSEVQQRKLAVAGNGDIKRLFDRIERCRILVRRWSKSEFNAQEWKLEPLHRAVHSDRFGYGSLFDKTLRHNVTFERLVRLKLWENSGCAPWFGVPAYHRYVALREIERLGGGAYVFKKAGPPWLRSLVGDEWMKIFDDVNGVSLNRSAATDATLGHMGSLTTVRGIGLNNTQVTDMGLALLRARTNLEELWLDNTQVTDAGLEHIEGLINLRQLTLDNTHVTDAGLAHLRGLTDLHTFDLSHTHVTDAGLKYLRGMTNLKILRLGGTQVSDKGLEHLQELPKLGWLWLDSTPVTDAGLLRLDRLTDLCELHLDNTQVTAGGLAHLRGLTKLQYLTLNNTQVTDAGLAHLNGPMNLYHLFLANTLVSDSGLAHLQGMTNLHRLDLQGTQVTDSGLAHLERLNKLQHLWLGNTNVSDAGIARLKRALPKLSIKR